MLDVTGGEIPSSIFRSVDFSNIVSRLRALVENQRGVVFINPQCGLIGFRFTVHDDNTPRIQILDVHA